MIIKSTKLAKIKEEEILDLYKISDLFIRNPNKLIYVINNSELLKGVISFGNFKRNYSELLRRVISLGNFNKNYKEYQKIVNYNCIKLKNSLDNIEEYVSDIFNNHNNIFNIPVVDNNNKLLYEYENINSLIQQRWSSYKDNKNLACTIKDLKYNKILLWCVGIDEIFQKSILEYFSHYISNFQYKVILNGGMEQFVECFKDQELDALIDFTGNRGTEYFSSYIPFYLSIFNSNKRSVLEYIKIQDLFDKVELDKLIYNYMKKNKNIYFFESQNQDTIKNLTGEEKIRINLNMHWSFYLKEKGEYFENLRKKVLRKDYNQDFINSRDILPESIIKNGIYCLNEHRNSYCNVVNGIRVTTDVPQNHFKSIKIFGPCIIFGALVNDSDTIPSYLQRMLNAKFKDTYRVYNYGIRGISIYENIRKVTLIENKQEDIIIFFLQHKEKEEIVKRYPNLKIYNISEVFNQDNTFHDYFFDVPIHCNYLANEKISKFVFSVISKSLNNEQILHEQSLKLIDKNETKVFHENEDLKNYILELKKYQTNKKNIGSIVMNCNPFTKGHQYLIEYAAKLVEILYVFVVEEDKSDFKFEDRIRLVKLGGGEFR